MSIFDKLTVAQPVKTFLAFCGSWHCFTALTATYH